MAIGKGGGDYDRLPPKKKPKPAPEPTTEEAAELRRVNSQCTLLYNLGSLRGNMLANIHDTTSNVFSFPGLPEMVPNRLINAKSTAVFMTATSGQLSLLQPTLRFFISSDGADRPVYFSDFVLGERMLEYASLRGSNQIKRITDPASLIGMNVGIKSFSWNFDNKHEGDRIVKANLSLHFGSMLDLLNESYLEFIHLNISPRPNDIKPPADEKASVIQWYQKRIAAREKTLKFGTSPTLPGEQACKTDTEASFKKLKVVVGYSIPENADTSLLDKDFLEAVSDSQRTLVLNLTKYSLKFNEDGSVGLDIEYVASIDAMFLSVKTDILQGKAANPRPEDQPAKIAQKDNWAFWQKEDRDDIVYQEGYIWAQMKRQADQNWPLRLGPSAYAKGLLPGAGSLFGWGKLDTTDDNAFEVKIQGVRNEVDFLSEKLELISLRKNRYKKTSSKPSVTPPEDDEQIKKLKTALEEAEAVYSEAKTYHRAQKYASFMNALADSGKIFVAKSTLVNQGAPDKPMHSAITWTGPASQEVTDDLKKRLREAAMADVNRGEVGLEEYIAKGGFLDMKTNASFEAGAKTKVYPIFYMRLADMLEIAMKNCGMPQEYSIIMGSFSPTIMGLDGGSTNPVYYSLGDLPISVDYFGSWWLEHVIAQERDTYKFRRFMDDLLNSLVKPLLNFICTETRSRLSIDYTHLTTTLPPEAIRRRLRDRRSGLINESDLDLLRKAGANGSINKKTFDYIMVYARQSGPDLKGIRSEDEKKGIFHLVVGADNGIAKKFSFTEKTMPQLRAMNIENANAGERAGALILPQDSSVGLVGNAFFKNGSMVYINADIGLGQAAARELKLGGYYRVVKSSNTISPGEFTTTIDCIWEGAPGSFGVKGK